MPPNLLAKDDGQILKQSLGDTPKLHVTVLSGHLSFDLLSVFFRFPMKILVAASSSKRGHCFYPEVVRIVAQRVKSLLEAHFDLEAISTDADNIERAQ